MQPSVGCTLACTRTGDAVYSTASVTLFFQLQSSKYCFIESCARRGPPPGAPRNSETRNACARSLLGLSVVSDVAVSPYLLSWTSRPPPAHTPLLGCCQHVAAAARSLVKSLSSFSWERLLSALRFAPTISTSIDIDREAHVGRERFARSAEPVLTSEASLCDMGCSILVALSCLTVGRISLFGVVDCTSPVRPLGDVAACASFSLRSTPESKI